MNHANRSPAAAPAHLASSSEAVDVLTDLAVDPALGLTDQDARHRLSREGANVLHAIARRHAIAILFDQLRSIVVALLLAASLLAVFFDDLAEGLAIFVVIVINTLIGFVTELRATRSMEALSRLGRVETTVIRDGTAQRIPAEDLVRGDIVVLEAGDIVSADIRLVTAAKLQADEATLTGESMPVRKLVDMLPPGLPTADQQNMLFKGTTITRGTCTGVAVATGLRTELGRISDLVVAAEPRQTPLEKRLNSLARRLVTAVVFVAVLIGLGGIAVGRETFLSIEVAIALAVAAIPEGLPIVATVALARGLSRMARRNALIARLSAVETLGATGVILTDKTGTLTENRMTVTKVLVCGADVEIPTDGHDAKTLEAAVSTGALTLLDELLTAASLCSNASVDERDESGGDPGTKTVGDPTEIALLVAAGNRDISRPALLAEHPEMLELAFNPDSKRMATLHSGDDDILVAVKGAPEAIIPLCSRVLTQTGDASLSDPDRAAWLARVDALGTEGLRTLAVARKRQADSDEDAYSELTLLGVAGLADPPRAGVKDAIRQCREAGITVVMVTGDHAATARNIAIDVGIVDEAASPERFVSDADTFNRVDTAGFSRLDPVRVFSRVSPEQKLVLIDRYQRANRVVAMTGDGVNDAPALKKADIGVAMGIRGTAVAKEAAAMVLQDDEFNTIVDAVAEGRAIFGNIRKFVVYLMSCNLSEVLIVGIATIAGAPLPLLPLQILFLNLVTDVFPALALGVGEGSPALMRERPRPADEPILTRPHWIRIVLHSVVIASAVLGAMWIAHFQLALAYDATLTISFCTLTLAQVWHVFNMREDIRRPFRNEITGNGWVAAAVVLCLGLLLSAVYLPGLSEVLTLRNPGAGGWLLILVMSLIPLLLAPVVNALSPLRTAQRAAAS